MPNDAVSLIDRITENGLLSYLWILFISGWAGTAKYLSALHGKTPTLMGWLIDVLISGFVGVITAMTCQHFEADFYLTSAITGIAAHNGTRSLHLIGEFLKRR